MSLGCTSILLQSFLIGSCEQGYKGLWGPATCAYAGPHGHLQWSIALSLHELLPNALPYFLLLALPLLWHRPVWVAALPGGALLAVWAALLAAMHGNMGEAGSVWCFSGVLLHVYYLLLPFHHLWVDAGTVPKGGRHGLPHGNLHVH